MTAYALIFVNFPAGATLDEVAVLYHSDMSTFYCHCLFLQPLSSKPHHHMINIITIFFTINTMINSITMINTRFQPIWHRSPAWPQVDQWLSPPAFYSASQTPASSHRWKARPCQRRHFLLLLILVQVWFQVTSVLGGVWKLQAPAAFGIFKFLQVENKNN